MNKGQLELAKAEVEAVVGKGVMIGDYYVVDADYSHVFNRIAFTKKIYDLIIKKSRIVQKKEIVNLNKLNQFQQRRAHLLPAGHPAMTHPRLARAMVNLSGARKEILDPFCGAGGILLEAGLCGLQGVGFDIDDTMLKRAKKNLDAFGIKNYCLKKHDATLFSGHYEAVVTDLPYGKSTKVTDALERLYASFFKNVTKNKIEKMVVGFPDFVDYTGLINKAGLKIEKEFTYYLHKSLSKKIVVIG